MADKEAAERFWTHALGVYLREEPRAAFLRLQDRGGADVPMLLWCLWLSSEGRAPSRQTMADAVAFSARWRTAMVDPLRRVRRGAKGGIDGLPADLAEAGRTLVAETEQALERLQMDHLAGLPVEPGTVPAQAMLGLYADAAGLALDPEDVAVVVAAA